MKRLALALLASSALISPAQADPISVAILTALGYSGAAGLLAPTAILLTLAGNAIVAALPALLLTAVVVGASTLLGGGSSARARADQTTPSDRQQTVRQSTGPRIKFYGRNKMGGTLTFFESKNGILYSQVAHNQGQIFQILEYWLADQRVAINDLGYVLDAPYYGTGAGYNLVRIESRLGLESQTAYDTLLLAFPGIYTVDHRINGMFTTLTSYNEVQSQYISDVYPQSAPNLRIVADCSLVNRAREGDFAYSDNPADCIYDYLIHPDGADKNPALIDLQSFKDFADICDEPVPKKGGGFIPRYRIATFYALNEQQRDVLPKLLQCCDAELYITAQGKIAIHGGKWVEPTITIDATKGHIISANFRRGQGKLAAFNELTLIYTEPNQDYSEVEGETWVDAANVALRGRAITEQAALYSVPSHAQVRRLGKIITHKANPRWIGEVTTNLYGLSLVGESTVNLIFPELGINESFAITKLRFLDDMTGVQVSVSSLSAEAYEWDAEAEEGTGPSNPEDTSTPFNLDPPENINVSTAERTVTTGVTGAYLVVTWDEPDRTALQQQAQYRESPAGAWQNMAVTAGDEFAQSGIVNEGADYDVQVRTVTPAGTFGDWSAPITVTATPDTSDPGPVTLVAANGGGAQAALDYTMPAATNVVGARIYRNSVNTFGTATIITTQYNSPSASRTWFDIGLFAGTYYYWIVAINGSGVEATPVATGALVVT